MQRHDIRCCCGRLDCALLIQNCSILESVEKNVHTAAELGQVLLARHESYMADAEKERNELVGRVSQLEMAKKDLELENARTIEENRALLDQLEYLNSTVADSETHMRSLEATLRSSQLTVRRLEGAANRASDMERHIAVLEQEQMQLQDQLTTSQSEAKSTVQRWKKAERGIEELQAQLERMEKEAREESDRHAEAMDWMHRRREMNKGLGVGGDVGVVGASNVGTMIGISVGARPGGEGSEDSAAAATTTIITGHGPPRAVKQTVVSHFVRDLLQDNANLQMGIAELRELLSASNDEIQSLREQLMYHQPVAVSIGGDSISDCGSINGDNMTSGSPASTLRAELDQQHMDELDVELELEREAHALPHQLHIHHHHYHVSESRKGVSGNKRKRLGLHSAALFAPSPSFGRGPAAPLAPPVVSKMASQLPHRWSVLSNQPSEVASSAPSTPLSSNHHRNSLFDRGGTDFDCPTSPATSVDPTSPSWRSVRRRRRKSGSGGGGDPEAWARGNNCGGGLAAPLGMPNHSVAATIFEEEGHSGSLAQVLMSNRNTIDDDECLGVGEFGMALAKPSRRSLQVPHSRLRHVASHESIVSLSGGLDIHTLQARPSQLSFRPLGTTPSTSTAVADVTARPIISSGSRGGSGASVLRNKLAAAHSHSSSHSPNPASGRLSKLVAWRPWGGRRTTDGSSDDTASITTTSSTNPSSGTSTPPPSAPIIASMRRKGLAPLITTTPATSSFDSAVSATAWSAVPAFSAFSAFPGRATKSNTKAITFGTPVGETPAVLSASLPWPNMAGRASGINQPGAIPGFNEYLALHAKRMPPHRISPKVVDHEALREGLEG